LQLEERHRLLGVVELAGDGRSGPVAGDVAADVGGGHSGLLAERGDQGAVDVVLRDRVGPDREEQFDVFAGFGVEALGLGGPQGLPGFDGLADDRVDGLGESGVGLVDRDVEQADGLLGQDLAGGAVDGLSLVLPADAADPQPGDLIAPQAGEQPGQCERADQLEGVVAAGGGAGEIRGLEVEPGPQQLGPDPIGDDAGVGGDQRGDGAGHRQGPGGVEPAGNPFPFLQVTQECAGAHEDVGLGARGDRVAEAVVEVVGALDVVADGHPVDRGDPVRAGRPGPVGRIDGLGMLGGQPSAGLGHVRADVVADVHGEYGGVVPAL
jgi:hypothetical protein